MSGKLEQAKDKFVAGWGVLGAGWGINRTMAQIHAYLIASPEAKMTDEIMEALSISRGNAHSNIKDLISWGLIKKVVIKGERKEFFEAEKDPWKMFCLIARERRRREIEPTLEVLRECESDLKGLSGKENQEFLKQIKNLTEFVELGDKMMERASKAEKNVLLKWLLKTI